jgi:hypothetical protein
LRARFVEAAAILKLESGVEPKEVRRAHGVVGARDLLGLVVQVREREVLLARDADHVLEAVLGVGHRIVGANRHGRDAEGREVARVADQAVEDRLHVRAVVAHEHDQRRLRPAERVERVPRAVGSLETKVGGLPAEFADRGCFGHGGAPHSMLRDVTFPL